MKLVSVALVLVIACKGKSNAPAAGSASGSAPIAIVIDAAAPEVVVDAAVPPPVVAKLELDDATADAALALAFGKSPRLPAINADGTRVATYHYGGGGPVEVPPVAVVVRGLDASAPQQLEIVDYEMSEKAQVEWATKPPSKAIIKKLNDRAAAIMKALDGFHSLVHVETKRDDERALLPSKIGERTLQVMKRDDENIALTLTNVQNHVVRRVIVGSYTEGEGDLTCTFQPTFEAAYMDPTKPKVYLEIAYRWRDDCGAPLHRFVVWDLPTAEEEELIGLVGAQFDAKLDPTQVYTPDALVVTGSELAPPKPERGGTHVDDDVDVAIAADGKSAWASITTKLAGKDVRASSVLAKTADGWRIIGTTWTTPRPNAAVNAEAKAGKLKPPPAFAADPGDAGLRAALDKLATEGLGDGGPSALVAIGSGPGERTTTRAALAAGWNAAWKGKTTIASSIARVAPSGTTGWVAANVELSKGSYKIPFRVFAVFDKASSGEWTLVQIHFSV